MSEEERPELRVAAGSEIEPPIDSTAGDHAHAVVRAALGMVPLAGSALQELFATTFSAPLEKRREAWMESVTEKLVKLESERGITVEQLAEREEFVSVLMNASGAAIRTHEELKLEALRNAVVNSACSTDAEAGLELQFVALIDQLSGWHLRLLAYLAAPKNSFSPGDPVLTNPLRDILPGVSIAIPELADKPDIVAQLYEDLFSRRLVNERSIKVRPGFPALGKRTSLLADQFLEYIRRPPDSGLSTTTPVVE